MNTSTEAREVLAELEACGTEQTRKTYRRHGAADPLFGVLHSDLNRMAKSIRTDQAMAQRLWATGNYDACMLALKVADSGVFTAELADSWMRDCQSYPLCASLAAVVAMSPAGARRAAVWRDRKGEWPSATGWATTANLALLDGGLSDAECRKLLTQIGRTIHERPNRTRYEMNGALIAIGVGHPGLVDRVKTVASRIGQVEVDHGDTSCKTPDAITYLDRVAARAADRREVAH